jgi:hypothetical protein
MFANPKQQKKRSAKQFAKISAQPSFFQTVFKATNNVAQLYQSGTVEDTMMMMMVLCNFCLLFIL